MDTDNLKQNDITQTTGMDQAASYLASAVQADPNNEEAWLLLGDYLTEPDKRKFCYENVLKINPSNQQAKDAISSLNAMGTPEPSPEQSLPDFSFQDNQKSTDQGTPEDSGLSSVIEPQENIFQEPDIDEQSAVTQLVTNPSRSTENTQFFVSNNIDQTRTETLNESSTQEKNPVNTLHHSTKISKGKRPKSLFTPSPLNYLLFIFPLMLLTLIAITTYLIVAATPR